MNSHNQHKICFIICTNNNQYANECIYHISQLHVPEGYEIELLTIEDATSMTSGYNEGMQASDAKYKVYLHHDTFILNKNLIPDILQIFTNREIGMIGVFGSPHLPKTGIVWHGPRVGMLCSNCQYYSYISNLANDDLFSNEYYEVEAIDGLMMVTQYDIPWRDDLFQKWDFYDVSQSMEFKKRGYKIVVPHTDSPWCFHDDGMMNLTNYYHEREIFLKNYQDECQ